MWTVALTAACDRRCYPYQYAGQLKADGTITVTQWGRICVGIRKVNLSTVFADQSVGIKQVADRSWLVGFMQYDLGSFDDEECRLEPAENPFQAKVLPMSSVSTDTYVNGIHRGGMARPTAIRQLMHKVCAISHLQKRGWAAFDFEIARSSRKRTCRGLLSCVPRNLYFGLALP